MRLGRESSSRARYEIKEKAPSFAGVEGGTRGTRCPPTKTCPLSGCPIADPSLFRPQARDTPAIMRSFHPSANESAESLQALVAPAPAFAAEPLRPNTTWHASELHVHSRSCESPVRARTGVCEQRACERSRRRCLAAERDLSCSRRGEYTAPLSSPARSSDSFFP